MMTSPAKEDFLCVSDRNQAGHCQSHLFINKRDSFCFSGPVTLSIWGCNLDPFTRY